jgi:hypothetical protein
MAHYSNKFKFQKQNELTHLSYPGQYQRRRTSSRMPIVIVVTAVVHVQDGMVLDGDGAIERN